MFKLSLKKKKIIITKRHFFKRYIALKKKNLKQLSQKRKKYNYFIQNKDI